jgi:hypothetical protein
MRILFTILLSVIFTQVHAQYEDGSEYNYDSTDYSDYGDDSSYNDDYSYSSSSNANTPNLTPTTYLNYERFNPPIDTITELVTYTGIVRYKPFVNDVYYGGDIDSLYWRAKFFLMQRYIKDYRASKKPYEDVFPKDMLIEDVKPDGENGRVIIRPTIPLMIRHNSHSSTQLGTLTFKVEIRVKEDKYKYKLTNFVHNTVAKGTEKEIKTYVEFYANSNKNVRSNDRVLLSIDRIVKEFVKDLYLTMKDPVILDPDDF